VWGLSLIEDSDYAIKSVVLWSEKIVGQTTYRFSPLETGFRKIVGQVAFEKMAKKRFLKNRSKSDI
jgi:hypothetical protein